jgi:hypothetical protein
MNAQTCPRCRLISEEGAATCDCGHEFASGRLRLEREAADTPDDECVALADKAELYRLCILFVLLQQVAAGGGSVIVRITTLVFGEPGLLFASTVLLLVVLGTALFAAMTAHRVARQMSIGSPGAWAVAVFFAGILAVLMLNGRVREWCRGRGIEFGLLGPTRRAIERLRRGRVG